MTAVFFQSIADHEQFPLVAGSAPIVCGAKPSTTELRNSTAPMKMGSSGQNDTKIRRRVGKNPAWSKV